MFDHSPANDDDEDVSDDEEDNILCSVEYRNVKHKEPHACKRESKKDKTLTRGVCSDKDPPVWAFNGQVELAAAFPLHHQRHLCSLKILL